MDLGSIVKLPSGELRRQLNHSFIFHAEEDGPVLPSIPAVVSDSTKTFFMPDTYSFQIVSAEIYATYPLTFRMYMIDIGLDKQIERGCWTGRMNNFLCIRQDWSPLQIFKMEVKIFDPSPDYGEFQDVSGVLILNGFLRCRVQ